jgi:hypothetical protein
MFESSETEEWLVSFDTEERREPLPKDTNPETERPNTRTLQSLWDATRVTLCGGGKNVATGDEHFKYEGA